MSATGKTPILLYGSTTPTNTPTAGNLTNSSDGCEIAINVADKNLFFKDSTNAVNTVPIRQSSASSNGWLSSTDWNTFNNKQPAGTYVTSVTGTAPVVSSGGTTPAISMAAANGSTNGYLTSTDWSTFNGKQAALVSGTNIKTVSGTTLLGSGDLGTIGTAYGGTGLTSFTANGVVFASSSSALSTGSSLTWNAGTGRLGVNTASPASAFEVYSEARITSSGGANGQILCDGSSMYIGPIGAYSMRLQTNGSTRAMVHSSGGVSIGNTTDPGATNLSVTGAATASSFIPTSSSVPSNGMYLAGSNTLGWGTNSTFRMSLDSTGALATTGSITSNTTVTATTTLKANLAVGSGASIDTSGQTALTLAASSNALLVSGGGYYLVAISEVTQTGQSGLYLLTNGSASLVSNSALAGTSYWKASTTTPANLEFSIAYSGGNYRVYNGCTTAGTYTFKATIIKIS